MWNLYTNRWIKKRYSSTFKVFTLFLYHVVFIVNFENLRFLIANVNQSLKKIILYEEKIQTFIDVKQTLIKLHVKIRNNVDQIEKEIRCYNEKMSNFEKIKIYKDFSQLDFVIRILCVIDVLRLRMNIIDVNLIIQWKESFNLRAFMQRIDRATKDSDRIEEFIWFHSIWCKKEKSIRFNLVAESSQFRNVTNANELKNKFSSKTKMNDEKRKTQVKKRTESKKTANEKRAQMKNILWRIINKSSELTCIRRLILLNLNELNLTRRSY